MSKLLVMIAGESGQGKSASLMNFRNPESVFYLGVEANKPLPFPDKFKKLILNFEGGKFDYVKGM